MPFEEQYNVITKGWGGQHTKERVSSNLFEWYLFNVLKSKTKNGEKVKYKSAHVVDLQSSELI